MTFFAVVIGMSCIPCYRTVYLEPFRRLMTIRDGFFSMTVLTCQGRRIVGCRSLCAAAMTGQAQFHRGPAYEFSFHLRAVDNAKVAPDTRYFLLLKVYVMRNEQVTRWGNITPAYMATLAYTTIYMLCRPDRRRVRAGYVGEAIGDFFRDSEDETVIACCFVVTTRTGDLFVR